MAHNNLKGIKTPFILTVISLFSRWPKSELCGHYPLYVDGVASDYTDDLDKIEVPSLFMVRSSWVDKAESWLKKKNPDFEVTAISSHAMFWEKPDQFNTLLSNFLNSK